MKDHMHPSDFAALNQEDGAGPSPSHADILAAIRAFVRESRAWRIEQAKINEAFAVELRQNTNETIASRVEIAAVRDGLATARVVRLMATWLGGLAAAALAIWQLAKFATTGVPPGPGP